MAETESKPGNVLRIFRERYQHMSRLEFASELDRAGFSRLNEDRIRNLEMHRIRWTEEDVRDCITAVQKLERNLTTVQEIEADFWKAWESHRETKANSIKTDPTEAHFVRSIRTLQGYLLERLDESIDRIRHPRKLDPVMGYLLVAMVVVATLYWLLITVGPVVVDILRWVGFLK